ncbi:hypothetical protein ONZ45_g2370 [Pleurotus djamor]|nr:hypothetical protein ONZ45_g2370 [Pleurotus djamor]
MSLIKVVDWTTSVPYRGQETFMDDTDDPHEVSGHNAGAPLHRRPPGAGDILAPSAATNGDTVPPLPVALYPAIRQRRDASPPQDFLFISIVNNRPDQLRGDLTYDRGGADRDRLQADSDRSRASVATSATEPPSPEAHATPAHGSGSPSVRRSPNGGTKYKETKPPKQHPCEVCKKVFTRPSSLKTHMNTHTGINPYKCAAPGCGKTFGAPQNASRHLRTQHPSTAQKLSVAKSPYRVTFAEPEVVQAPSSPLPTPDEFHWINANNPRNNKARNI